MNFPPTFGELLAHCRGWWVSNAAPQRRRRKAESWSQPVPCAGFQNTAAAHDTAVSRLQKQQSVCSGGGRRGTQRSQGWSRVMLWQGVPSSAGWHECQAGSCLRGCSSHKTGCRIVSKALPPPSFGASHHRLVYLARAEEVGARDKRQGSDRSGPASQSSQDPPAASHIHPCEGPHGMLVFISPASGPELIYHKPHE